MTDIVDRIRAVAPRQMEGHSNGFAFNMDGMSLLDLNAMVNTAADEIETLRKLNEKMAETLEWYANPQIYKAHPHGLGFDDRDLSFAARTVLAFGGYDLEKPE